MLKIKDNVDLKELEKFGYKIGQETVNVPYWSYGKTFKKQLDKVLNISKGMKDVIFVAQVNERKEITLNITTATSPRTFWYDDIDVVTPYVLDIIKAGLVEKGEDLANGNN